MSIDDGRRPEFPTGSGEWFNTLSTTNIDHKRTVTTYLQQGAKEVFGEIPEDAWNTMFFRNGIGNIYTKERGTSTHAGVFLHIIQTLKLSADNPQFSYLAASMITLAAEKDRVPVSNLYDKLQTYATVNKIPESRVSELQLAATAVSLTREGRSNATRVLKKDGFKGFLEYMSRRS